MDLYTFLIIGHIIGTVLGVGGATFAEIFSIQALKDGVISPDESPLLQTTYAVLRIGLFITVITGFAFLLYFSLTGLEARLLSEKLWAKMTIVFIIPINALLLQMKVVPFWLGSAISLTSWYAALILGTFGKLPYNFSAYIIIYVVSIAVVALVLHMIKKRYYKV